MTAAQASPARAMEKSLGQLAGEAGNPVQNANPEAAAGRDAGEDERWKRVLRLPCEFIVDLPVPGFKIADFLKLRTGSVISAHWRVGQDVPLRLHGTLIGWSEFEVVGDSLAVRLTELA
jgi:flagellar motor switch/type III secretory pathway protein FliN